jgi:hypothetical protein
VEVAALTAQSGIINHDDYNAPLGWCKQRLDMGIRQKIPWYPARASPHVLVAGQSGAGKTKFLELFASRCVRDLPCDLFLADPKCIDFTFAKGSKRFWLGEDCTEALEAFHSSMMARVNEADKSIYWKILIFDELAAFTLLQPDKKRVAAIQNMLASTLLLGRGVRHILVCGVQKAMMDFFGSGGRSQFGTTVLMGNVSNDREQVQMLMSAYKDIIGETANTRGQFWVTMDGEGIRRGQTPWITDIDRVHALIIEGLNRNTLKSEVNDHE